MLRADKWRVSKRRLSVVNDFQKITLRVYAPHHNAVKTMNDLQLTVDRVCDLLNGCDKLLRNERDTLQVELARVQADNDAKDWAIANLTSQVQQAKVDIGRIDAERETAWQELHQAEADLAALRQRAAG